jgi:hypothetical protein
VVELHGEIDLATSHFLTTHLDAATCGDRPNALVDPVPVAVSARSWSMTTPSRSTTVTDAGEDAARQSEPWT